MVIDTGGGVGLAERDRAGPGAAGPDKAPDFGWRLHGRVVGVLPDRSFDLAGGGPGGVRLERYCRETATLQACLNCGACTAVCGLAGEGSLFPRRQVTLVRLGLADRVAVDPDIWHCYGCEECSAWCPSGAKPGRIMGALRHLATERFAYPRSVAVVVNSPRLFWLAYVAAAGLVAAMVAAAGSFTPGAGPIRYAGMLPDAALIPFFVGFTLLALAAVVVGAARAWRAWYGSSLWTARPLVLGRALGRAAGEILAHRRFGECSEHRLRAWAHRAVLYGFLGLLALSGVVALRSRLGLPYPLSIGDPLKVLGNVCAALLIGGASFYVIVHVVEAGRREASSFFDWLFPVNVLLAALSGVGAEAVRVGEVRAAAYPVYFTHLVLVFALFVLLPYTKFAHAGYRLLAVAGHSYESLLAEDGTRRSARRAGKRRPIPSRAPAEAVPEALLGLGQTALAGYSDAALADAYYRLRDEAEPRGPGRYYPNVKRLFATAFEREKDRREVRALVDRPDKSDVQEWYEDAVERPCTWWVENHLLARRALTSCMSCGMCTSVCPAAEHYEEYDPRLIVDTALSGDEHRLVDLLKSDLLWYCSQCGSCTGRCPRENDVMALVTSLRLLAQLKGYHVYSVRGRQQYAGRHLWGANLWNRGVSLYFRDPVPEQWPDFGPRYARAFAEREEQWARVGASPDTDGQFGGRKVDPATLEELRACIRAGGALFLWERIEQHGAAHASELDLDLDEYLLKVSTEG